MEAELPSECTFCGAPMTEEVDKLRLEAGYTTCRKCAELQRRNRGVQYTDSDGNVHTHINHTPEIRRPEWGDKPNQTHD